MQLTGAKKVRTLAIARLFTVAGGGAAYIGLLFVVYDRGASSLWVVAVMLATTGAQSVYSPLVGGLADRIDPRSVIVGSSLLCAVCWAVLAAASSGSAEPWILVALASVASLAETPVVPASLAATATFSAPSSLAASNAQMQGAFAAGRLLGPAVGTLLFAVSTPTWLFIFNVFTLTTSAMLVWLGTPKDHTLQRLRRQSPLGAAVVFIRRDRSTALMLTSSAVAWVSTSFAMVAEVPLAARFDVGGVGLSLLTAGWGLGLLAGSVVAGRVLLSADEATSLILGRLIMGTGIITVAGAEWFAVIPMLFMIGGIGSGILAVAMNAQVQRRAPAPMRARVFAIFGAVGSGAFVLGLLCAGLVTETLGDRAAFLIGGAGTLLSALPLFLNLTAVRLAAPVDPSASSERLPRNP